MKYSIAAMVLVGLASAEQLKQSEEPKPKDAQNELGGVTGGAEPKKADAAPKDKKEGEGAKPEGDAKKEGGDAKKSDAKDGDKKTEAKDGDKKAESAQGEAATQDQNPDNSRQVFDAAKKEASTVVTKQLTTNDTWNVDVKSTQDKHAAATAKDKAEVVTARVTQAAGGTPPWKQAPTRWSNQAYYPSGNMLAQDPHDAAEEKKEADEKKAEKKEADAKKEAKPAKGEKKDSHDEEKKDDAKKDAKTEEKKDDAKKDSHDEEKKDAKSDSKSDEKKDEKKDDKKEGKEEHKEEKTKEESKECESGCEDKIKKQKEEEEAKKEAEAKKVKGINNAADRNQDIADKARADAFQTVVSQESGEKDLTDDVAANHAKAADKAEKQTAAGVKAYDYQRRGTAPAARDSLRFVDTQNEGLNGVKYGGRASLAQISAPDAAAKPAADKAAAKEGDAKKDAGKEVVNTDEPKEDSKKDEKREDGAKTEEKKDGAKTEEKKGDAKTDSKDAKKEDAKSEEKKDEKKEDKKEEADPKEQKQKAAKEQVKEAEQEAKKEEEECENGCKDKIAKERPTKGEKDKEEEDAKKKEKKDGNALEPASSDENQKNTDAMRKAAFDSVVKQEGDEKEKTSAITKDHGDRASDAKKALDVAHKQLDGHRRNGAPAARDSLRFVDTENEDYDGKKYGGRALAQLVTDLGMTSSPAEEAKEKRDFPDKNAKPVEDAEQGKDNENIKGEAETKQDQADAEKDCEKCQKKIAEQEEEEKEEEAKRVKPVLNAADRNQQIADNHRKDAFQTVVSQEEEEKENTGAIAAGHTKDADKAAQETSDGVKAYDYQRRGTAPSARDSLRYVDTQNEGLNGNKYGMRASLAQQNYRVMSQDFVNPAVFTSVESVVGANASDSYERSSEAPQSNYEPYNMAVAYPRQSLMQLQSGAAIQQNVMFHGVRQPPVVFSQYDGAVIRNQI